MFSVTSYFKKQKCAEYKNMKQRAYENEDTTIERQPSIYILSCLDLSQQIYFLLILSFHGTDVCFV